MSTHFETFKQELHFYIKAFLNMCYQFEMNLISEQIVNIYDIYVIIFITFEFARGNCNIWQPTLVLRRLSRTFYPEYQTIYEKFAVIQHLYETSNEKYSLCEHNF